MEVENPYEASPSASPFVGVRVEIDMEWMCRTIDRVARRFVPLAVVSLLLAMPSGAAAEGGEPADDAAETSVENTEENSEEASGERAVDRTAPAEADESRDAGAPRGVRILAESGLGLVGGGAGTIAIAAAAWGIGNALAGEDRPRGYNALALLYLPAALGYPAMTGLGAWGGGKLTGGRGALGPAIAGAYIGTVGSAILSSAVVRNVEGVGPSLTGFSIILGTVGGSVIGYELSHSRRTEFDRDAATSSLRLSIFRTDSGGWSFGLNGNF